VNERILEPGTYYFLVYNYLGKVPYDVTLICPETSQTVTTTTTIATNLCKVSEGASPGCEGRSPGENWCENSTRNSCSLDCQYSNVDCEPYACKDNECMKSCSSSDDCKICSSNEDIGCSWFNPYTDSKEFYRYFCDLSSNKCLQCIYSGYSSNAVGITCRQACGADPYCEGKIQNDELDKCDSGSPNMRDVCDNYCYVSDGRCDSSCPNYTGDKDCGRHIPYTYWCSGDILKSCDENCKLNEENCSMRGLNYFCNKEYLHGYSTTDCFKRKYPYVSIEYSHGTYYLDDYLDFPVNSFDDVSGVDIINLEILVCKVYDCGDYINYYHDCEGSTWCNYTFRIKLNETGTWYLYVKVRNKGGYTNMEYYYSATVLPKEEKIITSIPTSTSTLTSTLATTTPSITTTFKITTTTLKECSYAIDCCGFAGENWNCVNGVCKQCSSGKIDCFTCLRSIPESIVSLLNMIISFFKNIFGWR
jgi:hypothetical protein